ncbi:MAG: hypothetical protein WCT39_07280, partial [Candidatus Margulisiibacteriota bacterium]
MPGDTSITVIENNKLEHFPWTYDTLQQQNRRDVVFDRESALHGAKGIRIRKTSESCCNWITSMLPFHKDSWQRFYFRLDSFDLFNKTRIPDNIGFMCFIRYEASEVRQPEQNTNLIQFRFKQSHNTRITLLNIALPKSEKDKESFDCIAITPGRTYCVESHVSFFTEESVRVSLFIDGARVVNDSFTYLLPKDYFAVYAGDIYSLTRAAELDPKIEAAFSLDDFTVSDKQIPPIPCVPNQVGAETDSNKVRLICTPFSTNYPGETLKGVYWRVFRKNELLFPDYASIQTNINYFQKFTIPFPIDSGEYVWQAQYMNNFNVWGDFSQCKPFVVSRKRNTQVTINDVFFSEEGKSVPLKEITTGKWMDLHIFLERQIPWNNLNYCLIYFNNQSYLFGHQGNRGGVFNSKGNYIYNISLGESPVIFERSTENSMNSQKLISGKTGLYIDGSPKALLVDSVNGRITLRAKILFDALPGDWMLSGFVEYVVNRDPYIEKPEISNLLRKKIAVVKYVQKSNINIFILFGIFLLSAIFVVLCLFLI